MERRVLIAIFLSFIVLYAYQALVVKPTPKTVSPGAVSSHVLPKGAGAAAGGAATSPAAPAEQPPRGNETASATVVGDTTERDIRIETRDVIAVFTNRGARLKSWRLKKYRDQQMQPQELIENQTRFLSASLHPAHDRRTAQHDTERIDLFRQRRSDDGYCGSDRLAVRIQERGGRSGREGISSRPRLVHDRIPR